MRQRRVIRLSLDLTAVDPYPLAQFAPVDADFRIAVDVAVEAGQDIIRDRPWLGFEIPDVLYLKAGLLHHLAGHGLLKGLPDLRKSRYQRIERYIAAALVLRVKEVIPVNHADYNSGNNPRINGAAAGRADNRALRRSGDGPASAGSAVYIVTVP